MYHHSRILRFASASLTSNTPETLHGSQLCKYPGHTPSRAEPLRESEPMVIDEASDSTASTALAFS